MNDPFVFRWLELPLHQFDQRARSKDLEQQPRFGFTRSLLQERLSDRGVLEMR
ncbi:hypothetical protein [Stutzerimonas nitrititolerans]|uniref:hypothetical protein n=1 Tax=Stutzerimonas nitrititolerans TaxID=2482751 RepID=UPI002898B4E4|nr:hypothetical protein [Stutzerimonas nitrititolerans]